MEPHSSGGGNKAELPRFMNVAQVATYLQLNEKKIYALVQEGNIPATKVTGKWMFPRELIDRWLLESSYGGMLTDRLAIAGSDDPLLYRVVLQLAEQTRALANLSYSSTGTRLGLSLLARHRADACALHWGPVEESRHRHRGLLNEYPQHADWVLIRIFHREQGLMVRRGHDADPKRLLNDDLRWVMRQQGAGSQRFLQDTVARYRANMNTLTQRAVATALSERDAASQIAMGDAEVAPGTRGSAREFGLDFVSMGWEAFDLAMYRGIYFRKLFQQLLEQLGSEQTRHQAERLGGYDFGELGNIVWTAQ